MTPEQQALGVALIVLAVPPVAVALILIRHWFDDSPSLRDTARVRGMLALLAVAMAAFALNAFLNWGLGDEIAAAVFLIWLVVDASAITWLWQYTRGAFR